MNFYKNFNIKALREKKNIYKIQTIDNFGSSLISQWKNHINDNNELFKSHLKNLTTQAVHKYHKENWTSNLTLVENHDLVHIDNHEIILKHIDDLIKYHPWVANELKNEIIKRCEWVSDNHENKEHWDILVKKLQNCFNTKLKEIINTDNIETIIKVCHSFIDWAWIEKSDNKETEEVNTTEYTIDSKLIWKTIVKWIKKWNILIVPPNTIIDEKLIKKFGNWGISTIDSSFFGNLIQKEWSIRWCADDIKEKWKLIWDTFDNTIQDINRNEQLNFANLSPKIRWLVKEIVNEFRNTEKLSTILSLYSLITDNIDKFREWIKCGLTSVRLANDLWYTWEECKKVFLLGVVTPENKDDWENWEWITPYEIGILKAYCNEWKNLDNMDLSTETVWIFKIIEKRKWKELDDLLSNLWINISKNINELVWVFWKITNISNLFQKLVEKTWSIPWALLEMHDMYLNKKIHAWIYSSFRISLLKNKPTLFNTWDKFDLPEKEQIGLWLPLNKKFHAEVIMDLDWLSTMVILKEKWDESWKIVNINWNTAHHIDFKYLKSSWHKENTTIKNEQNFTLVENIPKTNDNFTNIIDLWSNINKHLEMVFDWTLYPNFHKEKLNQLKSVFNIVVEICKDLPEWNCAVFWSYAMFLYWIAPKPPADLDIAINTKILSKIMEKLLKLQDSWMTINVWLKSINNDKSISPKDIETIQNMEKKWNLKIRFDINYKDNNWNVIDSEMFAESWLNWITNLWEIKRTVVNMWWFPVLWKNDLAWINALCLWNEIINWVNTYIHEVWGAKKRKREIIIKT